MPTVLQIGGASAGSAVVSLNYVIQVGGTQAGSFVLILM